MKCIGQPGGKQFVTQEVLIMAQFDRQPVNVRTGATAQIDEGLRTYMLRV